MHLKCILRNPQPRETSRPRERQTAGQRAQPTPPAHQHTNETSARATKHQQYVTGVIPVKPPRFASASLKEQRGAKKKIDSYRMKMRQSNFINGTHNKCVSVMSMVDTEVCRSLVEQMLLPGCTYDVTDKIQMRCVADFYEMKENTTGVTGEI